MDKVIFSRSFRKQYFTYEISLAFINALDKKMLPVKTFKCVERIEKRLENIKILLFGDKLLLSPKDSKRYIKITKSYKTYFVNKLNKNVGAAFLNMMLCMVEASRVEAKFKNNKLLLKELVFLNNSLFTLYKHTDCNLKYIDDMIIGSKMSDDLFALCCC